MGSNLYTCALRGAPSRSQPETPMPPDRITGFNPGPWNHHPGLSFLVCTRKAVCNLLNHIPCEKHVVVQGGKWIGTKPIRAGTEVNLYGVRLACYNTAILPISCQHMALHTHIQQRMDHRTHLLQQCMNITSIGMLTIMP